MPKFTSDAEFIKAWNDGGGSAAVVAAALKMTERAVHSRRRTIENKLGIKLAGQPRGLRNYEYMQTAHRHAARVELGIEEGVVIVFSDAHFHPGLRTTAYDGLLWAIREMQPKAVICNGDAFDGASISRHPRIGWDSKPSVLEELKACEYALGEIEDVAKQARRGTKLTWPLGNHCSRFESRLAAQAPEFQGVKGFTLKDHFPAWTPCWSCWPTEDVVVKHRFRSGVHATHLNTVNSGKSIVTGHLHSLKVTPYNDYSPYTRFGVDTGTLADPEGPQFLDYTEDNPTGWRSGFAVLTLFRGKLLWPELVHRYEPGIVQFRGKLIDVAEGKALEK